MARRRKKKRQFFDEDESASKKAPSFSPQVQDQIESWAEEAAQAHGLVLFDVELLVKGRWIIRVYVDHPGKIEPGKGINVHECAQVSRYIEAYLDASEAVPERYVIEVSSPGIERELKKPRHLQQAVGEDIQLVVREQVAGKNKVIGKLLSFEDGTLSVQLEDDEGEPVDIDWANVKEARLKYDYDF